MSVLALRLAAPLQAWGASSRFARRSTEAAPTKSGIIGMVAAAQGRRRQDSIEDLVSLRFGVRVDQPGKVLRDFQTARPFDGGKSMPLSERFYLEDAVFLVGIEGDADLLEGIAEALGRPHFPLYLGRRSCPPMFPMCLRPAGEPRLSAVRPGAVPDLLKSEPWQAAPWYRRTQPSEVKLSTQIDAAAGEAGDLRRDLPVSFDPERREYEWRAVVDGFVEKDNPDARRPGRPSMPAHSPMSIFGDE